MPHAKGGGGALAQTTRQKQNQKRHVTPPSSHPSRPSKVSNPRLEAESLANWSSGVPSRSPSPPPPSFSRTGSFAKVTSACLSTVVSTDFVDCGGGVTGCCLSSTPSAAVSSSSNRSLNCAPRPPPPMRRGNARQHGTREKRSAYNVGARYDMIRTRTAPQSQQTLLEQSTGRQSRITRARAH